MEVEIYEDGNLTNSKFEDIEYYTSIERSLKIIIQSAMMLTSSKRCVLLKKISKERYSIIINYDVFSETDEEVDIKEDEVFTKLQQGTVIVSNDYRQDPRSKNVFPEIKRVVFFPVRVSEDLFKVLMIADKEKPYRANDIRKINDLASPLISMIKLKHFSHLGDLNESRDTFISLLSHELRTPLSGIVGIIELLQEETKLSEKQKSYIRLLSECSFQLLNLMNNLLDFSRITRGRLILQREPFSLPETLRNVCEVAKAKAIQKNLAFESIISPSIPSKVIGDSQRLIQVLNNLISNSCKFTNSGKIVLRVWKEDNNIYFSIEDTGIGIEKDKIEHIFDTFFSKQRPSEEGAGLGLKISKEIVMLMNGNIFVDSKGKGKGSKFTFFANFPEVIDVDKLPSVERAFLDKTMILIVDDRVEMRIFFSDLLDQWGCSHQTFASSEESIQYLRKNSSLVQIMIIDINMPITSGIELSRWVKKNCPHIHTIGVSSIGMIEDLSSFDKFFLKPIDQSKLFDAILDLSKKINKPIESKNLVKISKSPDKIKVCIVDDVPSCVFTFKNLLMSCGVAESNIFFYYTGASFLSSTQNFDLIFLDIIMPEMDGFDCARKFRLTNKTSIIIGISASIQAKDKELSYAVGMLNFIIKPITRNQIKNILDLFSG